MHEVETAICPSEDEMGRRIGIQKGNLIMRGPSWLVRFTEYRQVPGVGLEGEPRTERVGPCTGPGALTRREAQRKANELYLDEVNQRNLRPSSSMMFKAFIETKFQFQVIDKKKAGGKKHYGYILKAFLMPAWGNRRLCDIGVDEVEALLSGVRRQDYSWQVARHCQTTISRIFGLAKKLRLYRDDNPAVGVDLGEPPRTKKRPGYTWEQAAILFSRLKSPAREMAKLSVATSMNVAEMCGVRLKWCNFTDQIKVVEGEVLAPHCIAVRENYYENEYGSLKTGRRLRNVPLTPELAAELAAYVARRDAFSDAENPLFASRNGTPTDQHNISNRQFRPLQVKVGFPVTWHGFRRAHSTFVGTLHGVSIEDRMATMGHADAAMTLHYSIADVERRRQIPARILETIAAQKVPPAEDELEEMEAQGGIA
jgi:integrase